MLKYNAQFLHLNTKVYPFKITLELIVHIIDYTTKQTAATFDMMCFFIAQNRSRCFQKIALTCISKLIKNRQRCYQINQISSCGMVQVSRWVKKHFKGFRYPMDPPSKLDERERRLITSTNMLQVNNRKLACLATR